MRNALLAGVSLITLAATGGVALAYGTSYSVTISSTSANMPPIFPGNQATTYTISSSSSVSQSPLSGAGGSDLINTTADGWPVPVTLSCSFFCWGAQTATISGTGNLTAVSYVLSASTNMTSLSTTSVANGVAFTFQYSNAGLGSSTAVLNITGGVFKVAANPLTSVSSTSTVTYQSTTDSFTTSSTVRSAIALTPISTMQFGSIAVEAATAGTLTLGVDGSRTVTGGVDTATYASTTPAAGKFSVKADSGASYVVTLPSTLVLTKSLTTQTITATSFTASPTLSSLLGTGTAQTYSLGATLTVPAATPSGSYAGTFTVTASYN